MGDYIKQFIFLWSVIDPVGTLPVFLAVTASFGKQVVNLKKLALKAVSVAALVLIFFIVAGELMLDAMGIPLSAFQVAGGLVLFLFAMTMIFGDSKPEEEMSIVSKGMHSAVFPLAIPSIASPGAMMAVVLLTDNHRYSVSHQVITTLIMLLVLLITLIILLLATRLQKVIGESGASLVSRVMGLILSAVAVNAVLSGLQIYFGLEPVLPAGS